ncbi:hypothetical protein Tco_1258214 [Tanacetum coccineum]
MSVQDCRGSVPNHTNVGTCTKSEVTLLGSYLDAVQISLKEPTSPRGTQVIRKVDGVFKELVPKAEAFSRGLYTCDIEQNDLTGGLLLNLSIDQVKAPIPDILGQFRTVVKDFSILLELVVAMAESTTTTYTLDVEEE